MAVIDAIREAANSMANGIPSRRRQISTTAAASSAAANEKRGATLRARSTNRVTAAESIPAPTSSEGTGHNCSSATPSPSRLVARILTVADCARIASIRSAAASRTCSQLSNTNSRTLPSNAAATRLAHGLARLLGDAQHRRHRIGHRRRIGDRSQLEKPDPVGKFIGQTRRDFGRQAGLADPAHPGQRHQPMRSQRRLHLGDLGLAPDEAGDRRPQVSRTRIQRPQWRKVRRRPGARTWNTPTGVGTSRNRRGPRSIRSTPLQQTRRRVRPPGSDRRARRPSPARHG